jgi:hypothetical protein
MNLERFWSSCFDLFIGGRDCKFRGHEHGFNVKMVENEVKIESLKTGPAGSEMCVFGRSEMGGA